MNNENIEDKFLQLKSRDDVANILEIKESSLRYFLYGIRPDNMYHKFTITKNNGELREIYAPHVKLKAIQRKLADILNCVYNPKPAAHGFIIKKGITTNAKIHERRKYVFNLDLEDFFSQIHFGRIMGMLRKPPYSIGREAALVIAQLVCYEGKLPQGAPTSPIISNMICSPLDTQLTRLARKYNLRYSRYADDITFSSFMEPFPKEIVLNDEKGAHVGNELEKIINKNSFPINYNKVRMFSNRKRQMVTGLVVNRFINLRREYIKEIRAILHDCVNNGIIHAARKFVAKGKCKNGYILSVIDNEAHIDEVKKWFLAVLKGKVEHIRNVRGPNNLIFIKYAKEVNRIIGEPIFKNLNEQLELINRVENSVFVLTSNSASTSIQGSGFISTKYGLFTNHHVVQNGDFFTVKTYKGERIATISLSNLLIKSCNKIDYALFNVRTESEFGWEIGNSDELVIGDELIVIGFPNYIYGNSPDIQHAKFTSKVIWMGQIIYTIDKRIVRGASGGLVLNAINKKVVGVIRCGAQRNEEVNDDSIRGFIPINTILRDLN